MIGSIKRAKIERGIMDLIVACVAEESWGRGEALGRTLQMALYDGWDALLMKL
jgi:hypothetical protein